MEKRVTNTSATSCRTIPIKIGGRRFTISCRGGTFGGLGWWTDTVCQGCSLCVGHSLKNLRHVASNAVSVDEAKSLGIRTDFCKENDWRYDCWRELWAKGIVQDNKGKITKIVLAAGFTYADSRGPFDVVRLPCKRDRSFAATKGNNIPFRIKQSQIDWLQTAAANCLNIHEPSPFNRIGNLYTWDERMAKTG